MATNRNILILVLLVGLATAFVAAEAQNCELMDGMRHAVTSCPAGILPVPLALGLIALAFLTVVDFTPHRRLVPICIYRPPRLAHAR